MTSFTVTVNTPGGNGTTNKNGDNSVISGDSLIITPTPNSGYRVLTVKRGTDDIDANSNGTYTVSNVSSDLTVDVTFKKIYTVTVTPGANGTTDKTGVNIVDINGSLTITPSSNTGYRVSAVTKDGANVTANLDGTYTIANVTSNTTVDVTFTRITYIVNVPVALYGSTNKTGDNNVLYNDSLIITPTPDTGYRVDTVKRGTLDVIANSDGTYTIANVNSDTTVVVTFKQIFTVTVTSYANGTTNKTGVNIVDINGSLTITTTPIAGYRVDTVLANGSVVSTSTPNSYTISNVNSDTTVAVTFTRKIYTVIVSSPSNGTTDKTGTNSVLYNDSLTITPVPAIGYKVSSVTNGAATVTANLGGTYTIANVSSYLTINVTFTKIAYVVTINPGANGSANSSSGITTANVLYDESLSFTTTPIAGYRVDTVTKNGSLVSTSTPNSYTILNVTSNTTVAVTFTKITYTVNVPVVSNGTTDKTDTNSVLYNDSLTITPVPAIGYKVSSVTRASTGTTTVTVTANDDGTYTISNVTSNTTVVVTFTKITYIVTVSTDSNGSTNKTGTNNVLYNDPFTFTTSPIAGYKVDKVLANGSLVSTSTLNSYTISNVTSDVTVAVTFIKITCTVTVTSATNGTTRQDGSNPVLYSDNLIIYPRATLGYRVSGVTRAGATVTANADGTYTITNVSDNLDININFTLIIYTYNVNVISGYFGTTNKDGNNSVAYNSNLIIQPSFNSGYLMGQVIRQNSDSTGSENIIDINDDGTYTINNVTSNIFVHVNFLPPEIITTQAIAAATNAALKLAVNNNLAVAIGNFFKSAYSMDDCIYTNTNNVTTFTYGTTTYNTKNNIMFTAYQAAYDIYNRYADSLNNLSNVNNDISNSSQTGILDLYNADTTRYNNRLIEKNAFFSNVQSNLSGNPENIFSTASNLANQSINVNIGPNLKFENNNVNGKISTSLPIHTTGLNVGNNLILDSTGNIFTPGTITAKHFIILNTDATSNIPNTFEITSDGSIAHSTSINTEGDITGVNVWLSNDITVNQNMWVSRDTSIGRDLWVDRDININRDLRVNNDIFSSTSYDNYYSSVNKKLVVNKGILDQVVANITGGSPDTISALRHLIQSFNASDVSVLNSVIAYQNEINNQLLKKIDILYTYLFNNVSDSLNMTDIFGTPSNTNRFYNTSIESPFIAPNLSYNDVSESIEFTEPEPNVITYNNIDISGKIIVSPIPVTYGTEETIIVSSSDANNNTITKTTIQSVPEV
jgi:hypothetical protein